MNRIKAERHQKLNELGHMIRGTSYAGPERSKGVSSAINNNNNAAGGVNNNNSKPKITLRLRPILSEKQKKLSELGKMIRGCYTGI